MLARRFDIRCRVVEEDVGAERFEERAFQPAAEEQRLVDAHAPGVSVQRRSNVDARNAATVTLADVQVDGADVLGPVGGGRAILERALDAGRACLAAEMVGVAAQSFETTVDYLKTREQFGVKIGTFQALQHRMATVLLEIEQAHSAVINEAYAFDGDDATARERAL